LGKRRQRNDNPTIGDYADKFFKQIQALANDSRKGGTLIGTNALLFFITSTLLLGTLLAEGDTILLADVILLIFAAIICGAISYAYLKLVTAVSTVVSDDLFALKASVASLFIAVTLALFGLLFQAKGLQVAALVIIPLQLVLLLLLGFVKLPVEEHVAANPERVTLWRVLDRINSIVGILSAIAWVVGAILKMI